MDEERRRCKVRCDDKVDEYIADFIRWGNSYEYDSQGEIFLVLVAFVEKDNGKVEKVSPERIRFTKMRTVTKRTGKDSLSMTMTEEPEGPD